MSNPEPKTSFYFNPRSREGSDFFKEHYTAYAFKISIHAPVKGATPGLYDIEL